MSCEIVRWRVVSTDGSPSHQFGGDILLTTDLPTSESSEEKGSEACFPSSICVKGVAQMAPCHLRRVILLLFFLLRAHGARFAVNGPILTVTVKEPPETVSRHHDVNYTKPWLDFSALKPNIQWSVQTLQPPMPAWLPSLTTIKAGIGYAYNDLKRLPSRVECTAKFALTPSTELQVQPSRDLRTGHSNLLLQISRGTSYLFCRLDSRRYVDFLRGSFLWRLPTAAMSSVRVTPVYDPTLTKWQDRIACTIEAVTGGAGRTKAVLQLERQNPTLAVVYALDGRNIIAPQICLYDAKITYQWNLELGSGSSVITKVDPTSQIEVTWTDRSLVGGTWVTDVRVPLDDFKKSLTADVRVRRHFVF